MLYNQKGNMMRPEKTIGSYCDGQVYNTIMVEFYNVLQLRICYKDLLLITMHDSIKNLSDLRKKIDYRALKKINPDIPEFKMEDLTHKEL